jgi:MFS family permease
MPSLALKELALAVNRRFFYGWSVLAVAGLGIFASGPGQSHIFSVFNSLIADDLGISVSSVSTAYGLATLMAAFGLPYVGVLIDRHGPRRVLIGVAIGLGLACLGFSQVTGVITLGIGFAALRFLGQGSLMLGCNNVVAQWFNVRRGFALSLMALGFALSVAVHPPLAQWLISLSDWRTAWIWLGIMTWVVLLPAVYLAIHDRPESLGLNPDGAEDPSDGTTPVQRGSDFGMTRAQAMRTSTFWIIAVSLGSMSMLVTALFFHQVTMFESKGLSASFAASLFPVSSICMAVCMPLFGRSLDRVRTQYSFAAALVVMCVSLVAMAMVNDPVSAVAYAIIFGVCNAAVQSHYTYMWPRFFGRRHLGSIQGVAQTIGVIGASIGPLPLAIAFDLTGSFDSMLYALSVIPIVCAIAVFNMSEPELDRAG